MKKSQAEIKALAMNVMADVFPVAYASEQARLAAFSGKAIFNVAGSLHSRFKELAHVKGVLPCGAHYSGYVSLRMNAAESMVIFGLDNFCVNGGSYETNDYFCIYIGHSSPIFAYVDGKLGDAEKSPKMPKSVDLPAILKAAKDVEQAARAYEASLSAVPVEFRDVLHLPYLKY